MKVSIFDTFAYGKETIAEIKLVKDPHDLPLKKDGWQFNWRQLFRGNPKGQFYQLVTKNGEIQGMLMFSIKFSEMPFMDNVEVATHNYGSKGRYKNVAGCLIAYACKMSGEQGKGNYQYWLTFVSKTCLYDYYRTYYGAMHLMGAQMAFSPKAVRNLITKYLNNI